MPVMLKIHPYLVFIPWTQTLSDNASDATQDGSLDALKFDPFLTPSICGEMLFAHGPPCYHGNAPLFFHSGVSFPLTDNGFISLTHSLTRTAHTAERVANQTSRWHKDNILTTQTQLFPIIDLSQTSFTFSSHDALWVFCSVCLKTCHLHSVFMH